MTELDRTQQRIIGVLLEKELAVPDSYPLTENALLAGCNQKSNRDPEMGLEQFEVHGALSALMTQDWVKTSTSTGSRTTRYAHRLDSHYSVDDREKAVICELLVRGPQAPGALKSRVARLGFAATPAEIEEVLRGMASKVVPMVERMPRRPRERDCRWHHLLGSMDAAHQAEAASAATEAASDAASAAPPAAAVSAQGSLAAPPLVAPVADPVLERRVERLEHAVEELRDELRRLTGG